ncbi:MAG: hypothetical protein II586_00435 [Butyrivibrio sp.]|nr:hypothetical protein [Butyrivibrio sp.]MBQ4220229.1 hypothetical protein [Butyrivibrio sp.]
MPSEKKWLEIRHRICRRSGAGERKICLQRKKSLEQGIQYAVEVMLREGKYALREEKV